MSYVNYRNHSKLMISPTALFSEGLANMVGRTETQTAISSAGYLLFSFSKMGITLSMEPYKGLKD